MLALGSCEQVHDAAEVAIIAPITFTVVVLLCKGLPNPIYGNTFPLLPNCSWHLLTVVFYALIQAKGMKNWHTVGCSLVISVSVTSKVWFSTVGAHPLPVYSSGFNIIIHATCHYLFHVT